MCLTTFQSHNNVRFMRKFSKKGKKVSADRGSEKLSARSTSATPANLAEGVPPPVPDPETLFHEAEEEPDHRTLAAYVDSIRVLREKGRSYREIAYWLSERGIDADHNAVYRVYTNSLSDYDAHLESQRDDEEAQEEASRNQ